MIRLIIAAHQPDFLPYPGLFYKISKCDEFVFTDKVAFSTANGVSHHRNYIKTPTGRHLLTVPVRNSYGDSIRDTKINYDIDWRNQQLATLTANYKKALHFDKIMHFYESIIAEDYDSIAELNIRLTTEICRRLGIEKPFHVSSEREFSSKKESFVVELTKAYGGDVYYSGTGAGSYLHRESFLAQGMELVFSDYKPIVYRQKWGEFIENLSIIDYLFNMGFVNPFSED